jgi:glutamine---fructose-6-phosphate transaminase (isomerizing)
MCGIVAIAGKGQVATRLVDGLKRLEYRGYDSAGIAVAWDEGIERRRAKGKIHNLQARLDDEPVEGLTGIAHTRWATHGAPNEANAHPHIADGVAVVHNGIIENYRELREMLEGKGRVFESETDTEVIAQLVAQNIADGMDEVDAFGAAMKEFTGAFAIAAIFADKPDLVIGARKGSAMVRARCSSARTPSRWPR